jgi:alpha-tubulin suppressor-like RCC1 family protein
MIVDPSTDRNRNASSGTSEQTRGTYIFTWGAGYQGQLGKKKKKTNQKQASSRARKYSTVPVLVDLKVVVRRVVCGPRHTAVVSDAGQMYVWGDYNDDREKTGGESSGSDTNEKEKMRHVPVPNAFITEVACGDRHTLALADDGSVYSWGNNKNGQLGRKKTTQFRPTVPTKISLKSDRKKSDGQFLYYPMRDIVQIACGSLHSMCLSADGKVYAFGYNKHGQTGLGQRTEDTNGGNPNHEPTMIQGIPEIKHLDCGENHSALVTREGRLLLCGFGEYLYPSTSQHFSFDPVQIDIWKPPEYDHSTMHANRGRKTASKTPEEKNEKKNQRKALQQAVCKQVACGQSHCVVLSELGNVYAWGSGDYGQIGHGVMSSTHTPQQILLNKDVRSVACGRYHSLALTKDGMLYSWGCAENGQLGLGGDENCSLPSLVGPIMGAVVGQLSCGEHHTAVLTSAPWSSLSQDVEAFRKIERKEASLKHKAIGDSVPAGRNRSHKKSEDVGSRTIDNDLDGSKTDEYKLASKQLSGTDLGRIAYWLQETLAEDEKAQQITTEQLQKDQQTEIGSIEQPQQLRTYYLQGCAQEEKSRELPSQEDPFGPASARENRAPLQPIHHKKRKGKKKKMSSKPEENSRGELSRSVATDEQDPAKPVNNGLARVSFLKTAANKIAEMTATVKEKGESQTKKNMQKMLRNVYQLRKEYDVLRYDRDKKEVFFKKEEKENILITQAMDLSEQALSLATTRKKDLEMKLNTVTIKIAEQYINRKNYENNIVFLKDEDMEKFNKLKALNARTFDTNNLYKKVTEMKAQATEEKEKVEGELYDFKHEIHGYQRFVESQMERFADVLDIVHSQNKKREQTAAIRQEKKHAKAKQRVLRLESHADTADRKGDILAKELSSLELKLSHFQDNFSKIQAATGEKEYKKIVDKFFFKGQIKEQLQKEMENKQEEVGILKQELIEKKNELEAAKAAFREDRWRDVAVRTEKHRGLDHQANKKMQDLERVTAKLAFAQEGLDSLATTLFQKLRIAKPVDPEVSENANGLWAEEKVLALGQYLEEQSAQLNEQVEKYRADLEERKRIEEEEKAKEEPVKTTFSFATLALDAKTTGATTRAEGDDLKSAVSAVVAIEPAMFEEIAAFQSPPPAVEQTFAALMTLFGQATDWKHVQEECTKDDFKNISNMVGAYTSSSAIQETKRITDSLAKEAVAASLVASKIYDFVVAAVLAGAEEPGGGGG